MALRGLKVIELGGLAPAPVCGMVRTMLIIMTILSKAPPTPQILSDFGAKVIRVDKTGHGLNYDCTARGKRSIALNLKKEEGADILRNSMTTLSG